MLDLVPQLPDSWQDTSHNPKSRRCEHCRAHWSMRLDRVQKVYVMGAPGFVKVGISVHPCERLAQIRGLYGKDFRLLAVTSTELLKTYRSGVWDAAELLELEILTAEPFAALAPVVEET